MLVIARNEAMININNYYLFFLKNAMHDVVDVKFGVADAKIDVPDAKFDVVRRQK